ncbi:MAG: ornithine carbamoyltransferase [Sulfolobales archaeon]|nr:ornithine carbamoyltransferase [Sulfolobales archaeon]MCX8185716.1 ornithine carbamoyltransferase [Sulfolobales archaeon]MDW7969659.1 ornithine carbamoyltransferase [Sulfolobales archaeon]
MRRLKCKDLLSIAELSREDLIYLLETSKLFKSRYYAGERVINVLTGKSLAMIFQKPSTRTRVSFEVAMHELGGYALYLNWNDLQLGRGETIADTARVLSRYVDGIVARVLRHSDLVELAKHSSIPVINALSDLEHPCQTLADLLTIWEKKGKLEGIKIAFVGDGADNVLNSLLIASAKLGINISIATPVGYDPKGDILRIAESEAVRYGSVIEVVREPEEAVKGADVVYTDVWVSMGQESERAKRIADLSKYRVTVDLIKLAKDDVVFMHCLPAKRGEEVVDEVIDGRWSVVWDQAENRLHTQKAVLALLL